MAKRQTQTIKPLLSDGAIARMTVAEREAEVHDRLACLGTAERGFVLRHLDPEDERSPKEKAIEAGFSESTAAASVRKLLNRPDVRMIVSLSLSMRQDRFDATAERVIEQLAAVGLADIRDLIQPEIDPESGEETGNVTLALDRASEAQLAALDVIWETDAKGRIVSQKIRRRDPLPALDKLARHLGLYADENPAVDASARLLQAAEAIMARTQGVGAVVTGVPALRR